MRPPPSGLNARAELAIVLTDDSAIRAQSRLARPDKPTNVLSFPSGAAPRARRPGIARRRRHRVRDRAREARPKASRSTSSRPSRGPRFLHLLGYDHEPTATPQDGALESRILRGSHARPYAPPAVMRTCADSRPPTTSNRRLVRSPPVGADRATGILRALARALFGWKSGTTRADIEVVLEAAVPAKPASRRKSAPC
jgi:hypothetical protein